MFNLSPKNDKFFDLFEEYSELIEKAGQMLKDYILDPSDAEKKFQKMKDLEHSGDEKFHTILQVLNNSFITPIDREDIYQIGKNMDDVLDFMEATASRYVMFNISASKEFANDFAKLVVDSTKALNVLMSEFKNMKGKNLANQIVEVNRIENDGDVLYRKAVRDLFIDHESAIEVIVWKEVYEGLENILDACEDVANIVEGVVMKHA